VMVLTSIIIGLGITHILVGIGSAIDRLSGHGHRLQLSWAHGAWLAALFVWNGVVLVVAVPPAGALEDFMAVVFLLWLVIVGFEIIPQSQFSVGGKHHRYLSKILRWKMSTFVIAISYLAMALAALAMEFAFHILGLVTSGRFIGPTARIFSWP